MRARPQASTKFWKHNCRATGTEDPQTPKNRTYAHQTTPQHACTRHAPCQEHDQEPCFVSCCGSASQLSFHCKLAVCFRVQLFVRSFRSIRKTRKLQDFRKQFMHMSSAATASKTTRCKYVVIISTINSSGCAHVCFVGFVRRALSGAAVQMEMESSLRAAAWRRVPLQF